MQMPSGGRAAGAQESERGAFRGWGREWSKRLEGGMGPQGPYEWGNHIIYLPKGTLENDAGMSALGLRCHGTARSAHGQAWQRGTYDDPAHKPCQGAFL